MPELGDLFRHWGYLGIVPVVVLGNAGRPIPEETVLALAGYLVRRGELARLGHGPGCPADQGHTRRTFRETENGVAVNRTEGLAVLGSAILANEECHLLAKLMRDAAYMVSWGPIVPGREKQALTLFQKSQGFWEKQEADGKTKRVGPLSWLPAAGRGRISKGSRSISGGSTRFRRSSPRTSLTRCRIPRSRLCATSRPASSSEAPRRKSCGSSARRRPSGRWPV